MYSKQENTVILSVSSSGNLIQRINYRDDARGKNHVGTKRQSRDECPRETTSILKP